jgi:hypothetical protein
MQKVFKSLACLFIFFILANPLFSLGLQDILRKIREYGKDTNSTQNNQVKNQGKKEPEITEVQKSLNQEQTSGVKNLNYFCKGGYKKLESYLDSDEKVHQHYSNEKNTMSKMRGDYYDDNNIYSLMSGGVLVRTAGKGSSEAERLLFKVLQILPSDLHVYIDAFNIPSINYRNPFSESGWASTGKSENDKNKFLISFFLKNFTSKKTEVQIESIVHEMCHVIAERENQFVEHVGSAVYQSCVNGGGFYDGYSCFANGKIYTEFVKRFYQIIKSEKDYESVFQKTMDLGYIPRGVGAVTKSLNKQEKDNPDYVSPYALTGGPHEDFAESCAHFILEVDKSDKSDGMARLKIDYFEEWNRGKKSDGLDIVKLRSEFRSLIGTSEFCKDLSGQK